MWSPLQSRARIFSRSYVYQLRLGPRLHRCCWRGPVGPDRLSFGQGSNLGRLAVPALHPDADVFFPCTLDLPRSEDRSRALLGSAQMRLLELIPCAAASSFAPMLAVLLMYHQGRTKVYD